MTYAGDGSSAGLYPVPGDQQPTPRVRPNAWWYAAVVILWVACVVLAVSAVRSVADLIDAGVTHNGSQSFQVPSGGLTIYTSTKPLERSCTIRAGDGTVRAMDDFSLDFTTSSGGRTWWAIASTPKGLAPGAYDISCRGVNDLDLWYGKRIDLQSIFIRLGIAGICGFLGLVALVALLITRHLSKSRIRRAALPTYAGPVPGWVAPGYGGPIPPAPANPYDPNAQPGWGTPPPAESGPQAWRTQSGPQSWPAGPPAGPPAYGAPPTPPPPPGWGQSSQPPDDSGQPR